MNILETEWWTLGLPPEWWAEQEDDAVVIGDRDDVGSIEISTLHKEEGEFSAAEVQAIAKDNGDDPWEWSASGFGDFQGCTTRYQDGSDAVREWYLARGAVLLFVTYCCDVENNGLDDAAVEEILQTLAIKG